MRIANNILALNAFNSLAKTGAALQDSIRALSTGLRINSASDDAAGFAVSEKMRSQIGGIDVALRNSQDGISLLQTAEGALSQTNDMLQRMRDLSVQASNDSLTSNDRQYIQLEIDQLKDEINRIAGTTQFNQKRILDGSSGALWASSDSGLRAIIHGGLTKTDNYGQTVSAEGNYRIEVTASPGEAQVQKSNIMNTVATLRYTKVAGSVIEHKIIGWEEEILIEDKQMSWSISLNGGDNDEAVSTIKEALNADEINSGWEYNSSTKAVTIKESGTYHIVGTNILQSTQNHIVIADGVEANIILEDVNIDTSNTGACAFEIEPGGKANIFLAGDNTLKSASGRAGIEARGAVNDGDKTASVVINSASSSGSSSFEGTLKVTGGSNAAAIGGPGNISDGMSGSIEINGGTIIANGGSNAAGIGGGTQGKNGGGTITINGGDVTVISPLDAGIGTGISGGPLSGNDNGGTVITITGGRVKAKGGSGAGAGIGGGLNFGSGVIKIKSGIHIIESEPDNNFINTCKEHDKNISGDYVFAVKGSSDTAAIGHGRDAQDMPGGIDLNADITAPTPPDVPEKPIVTVQTPAVIKIPIYDDIQYIEEESKDSMLSEISQFYNSDGVFMVSQPQTLTITQGNGQSASITLYATDTMKDVAEKINHVIADTFGHAQYTDNPAKFCTISDGTEGTSESIRERKTIYDDDGNITGYDIYATMLIRSAIPGKSGELSFSGDEEILRALGLNTIRESSESKFTASIYDAHSGKVILSGEKLTGNVIHDALTGVDIEFSDMAGINSHWDENSKRFILTSGEKYSALLHLKDNGITFHTGANMGEDFSVQLSDMSCYALGINGVNVSARESAARSISIIDRAITRVSSQRAKIGSYINGLEHTMSNLTTTSANLTEAESRIRDADIAQTMMDFVKLQILNQSGTSMLAQANQIPRSVMSILGN